MSYVLRLELGEKNHDVSTLVAHASSDNHDTKLATMSEGCIDDQSIRSMQMQTLFGDVPVQLRRRCQDASPCPEVYPFCFSSPFPGY